jgi:hypothetical protein
MNPNILEKLTLVDVLEDHIPAHFKTISTILPRIPSTRIVSRKYCTGTNKILSVKYMNNSKLTFKS